MNPLRIWVRRIAYWSGALPLFRKSDVLTVVMFHRVVSRTDPNFDRADPAYTIEAGLFAELLYFLRDYFSVVSLHTVMRAMTRLERLPEYPLLITFDDGWADNLHYAAELHALEPAHPRSDPLPR